MDKHGDSPSLDTIVSPWYYTQWQAGRGCETVPGKRGPESDQGSRIVRKQSDRYLKIVEWSDKDQCYVGTCPGLMIGGVHGTDEAEVFQELCEATEEWIKIQEEDGEPLPPETAGREYSGEFVLRVGKDLHKRIALDAIRAGKSLNSYCVELIADSQEAR